MCYLLSIKINYMAKKKVNEVSHKEEEKVEEKEEVIAPLTLDFGRADLNQLRDVVNQLISRS